MKQLVRTLRTVGLRPMMRLLRAYRVGWKENLIGYSTTRVIQTLLNVGFFDRLEEEGSVRSASFAAERQLDSSILESLCRSLYAQGYLDWDGAAYSLTSKGRLVSDIAGGWFDLLYGYEGVYHHLEDLLRGQLTYGRGSDLYRRAAYVAKGSGEIEQFLYFPIAIDILRRCGCRKVLDIGCGDATFLRRLCEESDVEGYGIDLEPQAIADGERLNQAAGLGDRIRLLVLDVTRVEEIPRELEDIDGATVFFVLHEILSAGEDAVIGFLQGFRRLFPGVPLVVFEVHRPTPQEMRRRPGMVVHYTLFHDLTNQRLVGRETWREIFHRAGVTSVEEQYLEFAKTSIFTLR